MPYNMPVFKDLVKRNASIVCVFENKVSYVPDDIDGVKYMQRAGLSKKSLLRLANEFEPDIIFICDRTIPMYNYIGIKYRDSVPVLGGNDTQWRGGKQWFNVLTSKLRHKRYFSHQMVAGMRQYEYSKRLGFDNSKIVFPLYSANITPFLSIVNSVKRFENANDILFVGRMSAVKGIDYLLTAWSKCKFKENSKLLLVGSGDFVNTKQLPADVEYHPFSNQNTLLKLAKRSKAFVLPSVFEPWGVVTHEFAAAGLPIIITNVCGSASHFVINGHNGFVVEPKNSDALVISIQKILTASDLTLFEMGEKSRNLAKCITPEMVASALLSTIK